MALHIVSNHLSGAAVNAVVPDYDLVGKANVPHSRTVPTFHAYGIHLERIVALGVQRQDCVVTSAQWHGSNQLVQLVEVKDRDVIRMFNPTQRRVGRRVASTHTRAAVVDSDGVRSGVLNLPDWR